MDFVATADQRALQEGVRDLLTRRLPIDRLLTIDGGLDPALWAELTELGVFSLRHPEAAGGLSLGFAETVLAFHELGAALTPGPLVASELAGHLTTVVPGELSTVIESGPFPVVVSHLRSATHVVVVTDDALTLVAAGQVDADDLPDGIDPLTPLAQVQSVGPGTVVGDATAVRRWRREGALLNAALQVGLATRLTQLAVAYAQEREQFGKPIGSFQAVKHLAADMYVRAELAKVAVEAAAVTLDDPEVGDGVRAVAGAALLAAEAATLNARSGIQIHGGMGFTWEVPLHLYLKRAWVQATEWGNADGYAEDLAERL